MNKILILFILCICLFLCKNIFIKFKNFYLFDREHFSDTSRTIKLLKENVYIEYKEAPQLFQTYNEKRKIPKEVIDNIQEYAPEYQHNILDDNDCIHFLQKYFNNKVLNTFNELKMGAHKADLIRYCLLYIYGGVYIDIKTELVKPLNTLFKDPNTLYSVIAHTDDHIYQGIISTPPQNPLFLSLIQYIVDTKNPLAYHFFCTDFFYQISKDIGNYPVKGLNNGKYQNYYLFSEKCSRTDSSMCYDGFDRYGFCCFIWDKDEPVIKSRRSSYPWK